MNGEKLFTNSVFNCVLITIDNKIFLRLLSTDLNQWYNNIHTYKPNNKRKKLLKHTHLLDSKKLKKRKPIVLVDDRAASNRIIDLFVKNKIEFVQYDIRKFETSCCADLPTTKAPSVIATEGIFKGEFLSSSYVEYVKNKKSPEESEKTKKPIEEDSAYW